MSYDHAKMVIWNPEAYDKAKRKEAALIILSNLTAKSEDVQQASYLAASGY